MRLLRVLRPGRLPARVRVPLPVLREAIPVTITPAHTRMMTLHLREHVEDHAPRAGDPHYKAFEAAKRRLKKAGLWRCVIDDELCGGEPELHHSVVEFSEINAMDPEKVGRMCGLHFQTDEEYQQWIESPGNLEVLCRNHHTSHYGIHLLPEPLWLATRLHRAGLQAPAEFVPAADLT